jgi:hypothetical protein
LAIASMFLSCAVSVAGVADDADEADKDEVVDVEQAASRLSAPLNKIELSGLVKIIVTPLTVAIFRFGREPDASPGDSAMP